MIITNDFPLKFAPDRWEICCQRSSHGSPGGGNKGKSTKSFSIFDIDLQCTWETRVEEGIVTYSTKNVNMK